MKLIQQLRQQSSTVDKATTKSLASASGSVGRVLYENTLNESIRYAPGDDVETWLNHLLCLDATVMTHISGCPLPENCDLYLFI